MENRTDKKQLIEDIVKDLLFLGLNKNDVRDIYKAFCDEYDMKVIIEGTSVRRRYERHE